MSTAGWIFLVGMRVFDLGGMIVWLVWYFRHKEDEDDWPEWEDWGRDPPSDRPDPPDPGGSGVTLPLPDAGPWPGRLRDHGAARPQRVERRREPRPGAPAHEPTRESSEAADARGRRGDASARAGQQAPGF